MSLDKFNFVKKVDKEEGKGLSTNDYTDLDQAEVQKLRTNKTKAKQIQVEDRGSTPPNSPDVQTALENIFAYMQSLDPDEVLNIIQDLEMDISGKVDKIPGKGLSTEDFTTAEKNKLASLSIIPSGLITMWSGSVATIPSGWALCDGSNGTPDLRDRFIVGAGGEYSVGNTGGAKTVALTVAQMPSHNHTASSNQTGAHSHGMNTQWQMSGTNETDITSDGTGPKFRYYYEEQTTKEAGAHSHTITVNNTGSGEPHENRPPYYALAYIMKL